MYEESCSRESSFGDYTRQMYQKRKKSTSIQTEKTVQPNIQQVLKEAKAVVEDREFKEMNSYGSYWSNYFNFQGRTRRGVYWTTTIINLTIWFFVAYWLEVYSSTLRDAWFFMGRG